MVGRIRAITLSAGEPRAPSLGPARVARLLPVLLASVACVLLAASVVPTSALATWVGALRGSGPGGGYTAELLQHFAERLHLAAAAFAAMALVVFVGRGYAAAWLDAAVASAPELAADAAAAARRTGMPSRAALGALCLVAAGLRLDYLAQPVRYDEALTFNEFASRPLYYALSFYPEPNNQLFHTLLVHLSYLVFGDQPWAMRLPALVAGVLLVPATYLAGRALYDGRAAMGGAALVAASSILVEYSTNARGYTLLCLLFMVGLALAAYVVRTGNACAWLALAVVMALGFYTIPTMLYAFATLLVWLAWTRLDAARGARPEASHGTRPEASRGGSWRPDWAAIAGLVVATAGLCLVLYLPPMLVSGLTNLLGNRFVTPLGWTEFATELPRSLRATWALWTRDLPWPVVALLVVGFWVATGRHRATSALPGPPLVLAALVACLPILVVQRVVPFERVWLFLLPLGLLTAAAGLVYAARAVLGAAARAGVTAGGDGRVTPPGVPSGAGGRVGAQRPSTDAPVERPHAGLAHPAGSPAERPHPGLARPREVVGEGLVAGVAVLVALGLGALVLAGGSVPASDETGRFPDAEAVTALLRDRLTPSAGVVTTVPASLPELQYYFRRDGVDPAALVRDPAASDRLFAVVPPGSGPPQPTGAWTPPRLVGAFPSAAVYELRRPETARS
jgi:Dolichyl-phosphate-mannose-protein mannosyltransferase